ncbi:MAG TPA: PAS domain-containing protein, partial [Xanthobacteraceae bacterium]|nr:PAS domain-containing protein [Xanthobacteraceae bacterium]
MRPHRGMLLVIAAAATVFAGLAAAGTLAAPYAIAGFAIVAAAALVSMRAREKNEQLIPPVAISERGDDLLRAVVAGLPDPVVALDRDGRVLALNERARAL